MTRLDLYKCELCSDNAAGIQTIGIKWFHNCMSKTSPSDAHTHLCKTCWRMLRELMIEEKAQEQGQ